MTKRPVSIRFSTDKAGRPRAHYWGLARRWLPISVDAAKLKLSTGEAVMIETTATVADKPFTYTSHEGDVFSC